ncbi:MAG: HXXEE domain-containing protein [Terriglobales bacterium]
MLILGLASALHNLEEWRGFEDWVSDYHMRDYHMKLSVKFNDPRVFKLALIFLSTLVLTLGILECLAGPGWLTILSKIVVFALLLNAIGHCCLSLYKQRLVPGTISALFLIIPLAATGIYIMHRDFGDTTAAMSLYLIASLAILPIAIYGGLWAGFAMKSLRDVITMTWPSSTTKA